MGALFKIFNISLNFLRNVLSFAIKKRFFIEVDRPSSKIPVHLLAQKLNKIQEEIMASLCRKLEELFPCCPLFLPTSRLMIYSLPLSRILALFYSIGNLITLFFKVSLCFKVTVSFVYVQFLPSGVFFSELINIILTLFLRPS